MKKASSEKTFVPLDRRAEKEIEKKKKSMRTPKTKVRLRCNKRKKVVPEGRKKKFRYLGGVTFGARAESSAGK